jgi:hypothetical protein
MHRSIYIVSFFIIITSHYSCKDSTAVEVPNKVTQQSIFEDIYALKRPTITLKGDLSNSFETTELTKGMDLFLFLYVLLKGVLPERESAISLPSS